LELIQTFPLYACTIGRFSTLGVLKLIVVGVLAVTAHKLFVLTCEHSDEELDRPTAPPSASEPVLCGRDLKAGGTWMGVHKGTGAFAAITNHVNRSFLPPPEEKKVSRGILIRELLQLTAAETHAKFSHGVDKSSKSDFGREFDGFNLLHGNLFEAQPDLFFISNRPQQLLFPDVPASAYNNASAYYRRVPAGVHCVSNGQFDDESWPKVRYLRRRLQLALTHVPVDVTSRQLRHAATAGSCGTSCCVLSRTACIASAIIVNVYVCRCD